MKCANVQGDHKILETLLLSVGWDGQAQAWGRWGDPGKGRGNGSSWRPSQTLQPAPGQLRAQGRTLAQASTSTCSTAPTYPLVQTVLPSQSNKRARNSTWKLHQESQENIFFSTRQRQGQTGVKNEIPAGGSAGGSTPALSQLHKVSAESCFQDKQT